MNGTRLLQLNAIRFNPLLIGEAANHQHTREMALAAAEHLPRLIDAKADAILDGIHWRAIRTLVSPDSGIDRPDAWKWLLVHCIPLSRTFQAIVITRPITIATKDA
jgi:hypothetical protein